VTECSRCYSIMSIRVGEEPTAICDHCAQELVVEESRLIVLADELLTLDCHPLGCEFSGCTCGSVEKYKAVRAEYLRLRRTMK
jgi:hypothetical protein